MQSAKRIVLIPPKNQVIQEGGSNYTLENNGSLSSKVEPKKEKVKTKIYDKIHRFIKVILNLAKNIAYDSNLRIKLKNGKYLEKSNIVDLLTHAMSVGKVLYGENEFIELLASSGVDPELIINDNVKVKLLQFINRSKVKEKAYNEEDDDRGHPELKRKADEAGIDHSGDIRNIQHDHNYSQNSENRTNKKRKIQEEEEFDISDTEIDRDRWEIPE